MGLFALDSGHWGVVWAYAPTRGTQLVSYDPERAREVFEVTRNRYEDREGLSFDSRTAWQSGSI
ncbi:hypothetical protein OG311_13425 [Streptomyces sp. NBC_01343]|uniref:hypothetical protein n=1 Tax=Streptomyces sp. NBC_01343 TaxID=2903832 RepID=UPI002E15EF5C|nr:hypothetical protein OG311_13425 [Streptomyces sp. NBC_01343]